MKYYGAAWSECGGFRSKNQDRAVFSTVLDGECQLTIGCVCDGIGSYRDSEISAQMVIDGIIDWTHDIKKLYPSVYNDEMMVDDLVSYLDEVNQDICQYRHDNETDIGCTMSVFLAVNSTYYILHVGDSRIYRVTSGLDQMTTDETTWKVADGANKKLLANFMGKSVDLWINRLRGEINIGDCFMIGSDGLYKRLTDEDVADICTPKKVTDNFFEEKCKELISTVYSRGEKDNVSCVLIYAADDSGANPFSKIFGRKQ